MALGAQGRWVLPFIGIEEGEVKLRSRFRLPGEGLSGQDSSTARQRPSAMAREAWRLAEHRGCVLLPRDARGTRSGAKLGAPGRVWGQAQRMAGQVAPAPAYGVAVGRAQGGREEGYEVRGCFVISKTLGTELKTKIFSRLLDSNEKLFNIKFVQFFKIYNFCFMHFFI